MKFYVITPKGVDEVDAYLVKIDDGVLVLNDENLNLITAYSKGYWNKVGRR